MKATDRDFGSQSLEPGDYKMRIDNPQYDGEKHMVSIKAVAVGGEFDGSAVFDYYHLGRKDDEDRTPFGVLKLTALLNAIGIEQDKDFASKDELNAYYQEMEKKLSNKAGIPGLISKINGHVFTGSVKKDPSGKYTNITKYSPVSNGASASGGGGTMAPEDTGQSW